RAGDPAGPRPQPLVELPERLGRPALPGTPDHRHLSLGPPAQLFRPHRRAGTVPRPAHLAAGTGRHRRLACPLAAPGSRRTGAAGAERAAGAPLFLLSRQPLPCGSQLAAAALADADAAGSLDGTSGAAGADPLALGGSDGALHP